MTEIKVLDKQIFNRIAAGEVVERPCSIVKELVENSIDAGATSISISVKNGGVDYIRVSDNGKGIASTDMKTAFLPHATSKIKNLEDLDGICTLGFRGEALPSIASVSRVTMVSRRENDDLGCRYCVDNGVEVDYGEIGAPIGTSVTVENLFERIPARKKFLNKNNIEENAITSTIERFILANYNVSFIYTVNDKLVYSSSGSSVENAIETVYGDKFLQNMIKIHSTMSDITLCGYINKPSFTKHSRSFQTLIVNGRYVVNDDISYAIYGCYQKYLMSRQFPTYVLHLTIPYDLVDVNVHPNKLQIKFAIPGMIKKLVCDAIKEKIEYSTLVPKEIITNDLEQTSPHFDYKNQTTEGKFTVYTPIVTKDKNSNQSKFIDIFSDDSETERKIDSTFLGEIPSVVNIKSDENIKIESKFREKPDVFAPFVATDQQSSIEIPAETKVIGKLFNTYIIVENNDNVYLIDQHAAHEKILYDRYVKEYESGSVAMQNMLIPYEFSVSTDEESILLENFDILTKAGFIISQKSNNSFLLKTVPLCCVGINARLFISDFLKEQTDKDVKLLPDAFKEKLMQHACKSATKGEDDLSKMEIDALLTQMKNETSELFCPHGRPISIRLSRSEIEKWFKRIV